MRKFTKCTIVGVMLSIVGIITGCGTANNNTPARQTSANTTNSVTNSAANQESNQRTNVSAGNVANSVVSQTNHGLKQGESLIGGNPVAAAPIPFLPKSRYRSSIPTSIIHVEYGVTAPKSPTLPATVQMSLPKSLSHDLTAYYLPLYGGTGFYVVGLNGMKATGQVGADGSYSISLENSTNTEIDLSSTGLCQGCAVDVASLYFPSARKDTKDYGGYNGTFIEDLPVTIETLNSNVKIWSCIEKGHRQLFGFAHYTPITNGQGTFMNEVFVGSSKEVQEIAPWVLQNTLIQHHMQF